MMKENMDSGLPVSKIGKKPKNSLKRKISIKVPVKSHVHTFLVSRFQQPYRLSLTDWLGMCVYHIFRRPQSKNDKASEKHEYTDTFVIEVYETTMRQKSLKNISDYTILKINKFVEALIYDNFVEYVDNRPEDKDVKGSILEWIHRNNFSEGDFINYENLKQKYFRYRKAKDQY